MAWLQLFSAGLLEIVWAVAMKQSHGFTRPWPTAIMVVAMTGSIVLLAMAMRSLPLGTAYMIWTGIGAVGAFLVGIMMLMHVAFNRSRLNGTDMHPFKELQRPSRV